MISEWTTKKELSDRYRNLISMLLTYPDKAKEILATKPELINYESIDAIERVADRMSELGSIEAAALLRYCSEQMRSQLVNLKLVDHQLVAKNTKIEPWRWVICQEFC